MRHSMSTWDRHPTNGDKGRVWRREGRDTNGNDWAYPWFYYLPHEPGGIQQGSIARTWDEAMAKINAVYVTRWISAYGLVTQEKP